MPSAVYRAWPTISMMRLCTTWDPVARANTTRFTTECIEKRHAHDTPYDAFHPVKRRHGADWSDWDRLFDRLSAATWPSGRVDPDTHEQEVQRVPLQKRQ